MHIGIIVSIILSTLALICFISSLLVFWFKKTHPNNSINDLKELKNQFNDFILRLEKDKATNTALQDFLNKKLDHLTTKNDTLIQNYHGLEKTFKANHIGGQKLANAFQQQLNEKLNTLVQNHKHLFENYANLESTLKTTHDGGQKLATEFQKLSRVFLHPSERGFSGETSLNFILDGIFGTTSNIVFRQYQMKNNCRADVFIKTPQGNIPIDSKFPQIKMDNNGNILDLKDFKTKLTKHINDVGKYISSEDNTFISLMYLPSQRLFELIYEKATELNWLHKLAHKNKVYIVAPNTLAIVLQIIDKIIREYRLKNNLENIFVLLQDFRKDWDRMQNRFEKTHKSFNKFGDNLQNYEISFKKTTKKLNAILEIENTISTTLDTTELPLIDNSEIETKFQNDNQNDETISTKNDQPS